MANRTLFASGESIGQYTVDQLLGPGHHYIAYRAHDAVGKTCVLKVLLAGPGPVWERHRTAAKQVANLHHEHLVGVGGLVELAETMAIVVDYVDGPSLKRWLEAYRPTPDETLALFRGILLGVDALHCEAVIHGGIHPGNVLLRPTEAGLITKTSDHALHHPVGDRSHYALRYVAPELHEGGDGTVRSDLWSLGCVLYELATGGVPFDATDPEDLDAVILKGSYKRIDPAALSVPPALAMAVDACLHKNPELRPFSCDDLSEMLYGNTIVKRISATRDPGQHAESIGAAFASNVGLAVARALGPGEGTLPEAGRKGASVEAVARRSYKPTEPPPSTESPLPVIGAATFTVLGLLTFLLALGILFASLG